MSPEEPKPRDDSRSETDYSELFDEAQTESGLRHTFPEKPEQPGFRANFPEKTGAAPENETEGSILKGSMVEAGKQPEIHKWVGEIASGTEIVQRDSGHLYRIVEAKESRGKILYKLVCDNPEATITMPEDDLIRKLGIEGSPWKYN